MGPTLGRYVAKMGHGVLSRLVAHYRNREAVATFRCRQCKASLPSRDARCRACGFATDYNPAITRRERRLLLGVGLLCGGFFLAIAVALAVAYVHAVQ
jgi:ribosomal protein L40E